MMLDNVPNENICAYEKVKNNIVYDKMGGRPSLKIKINGVWKDCLLDTGARVNVIDAEIVKDFKNCKWKIGEDKVSCANGSALKTKGRVQLNVEIDGVEKEIEFIVAENLSPRIIGGIIFLNKFGIKLNKIDFCENIKSYQGENCNEICSIDAKFGLTVTDESRFKKTLEVFQLNKESELYKIIERNKGIFMAHKWDIGKTDLIKHSIVTTEGPILMKPRRQPVHLEDKIDEAIKNLQENGIIRRCDSQWNTPLVCVWKKEKQDIRLCLDFRALNKITERRAFPMPNIEEMLDILNGAKYFSTIDLGSAYYQVELEEESKEKTAFSTKTGQFCFNRMPFGIAAAPATFQKLMTTVLGEIIWKEAVVYLDDILIFGKNKEEHLHRLERVMKRIDNAGLKVNPEKCLFMKEELKFLGHIINSDGIQTDKGKLEAIQNFERPKCIKNLRSFLGICNYYRKFIKNYAVFARRLEGMCGNSKEKLVWSDQCEEAFRELKSALSVTPVLVYPDFKKDFILDTDASFDTIGAVLSQRDDKGNERVIAYGSHTMNKHELGYCITRKELLAIYYFTQHFKHYLYGKKFTLRTDHKAITFMITTKKPITAQFQTWINFLSSLDMNMEYRKGSEHSNADAMSRDKCGRCTQCLMEHEDAKVEKIKTRLLAMVSECPGKEWQTENEEIRHIKEEVDLCKNNEQFKIADGILKTKDNKIWIPKDKRREFISEMHRKLCHAGVRKVTEYIKAGYEMEDQKNVINEEVQSCELCQKRKSITTKTKETIKVPETVEPFEVISIDFCGPLRANIHGKKYILGIIDHCSRYVSLTAVVNQDEKTTANVLMKQWILKFGAPRVILLDCGKSFESKVIKELADRYHIKLQYSSPYHHSSNGLIERQFRTIRDFMSVSVKDRLRKDWVEILQEIEFTINSTIQQTIGKSPAEVVFGFKLTREWLPHSKTCQRESNIKEVQEKQKNVKYQDENRINREFNVGNEVLVKVDVRSKEQDRFIGPFKIIDKRHDRSYVLKDVGGKILTRNVEWLKPYKQGGCEV